VPLGPAAPLSTPLQRIKLTLSILQTISYSAFEEGRKQVFNGNCFLTPPLAILKYQRLIYYVPPPTWALKPCLHPVLNRKLHINPLILKTEAFSMALPSTKDKVITCFAVHLTWWSEKGEIHQENCSLDVITIHHRKSLKHSLAQHITIAELSQSAVVDCEYFLPGKQAHRLLSSASVDKGFKGVHVPQVIVYFFWFRWFPAQMCIEVTVFGSPEIKFGQCECVDFTGGLTSYLKYLSKKHHSLSYTLYESTVFNTSIHCIRSGCSTTGQMLSKQQDCAQN